MSENKILITVPCNSGYSKLPAFVVLQSNDSLILCNDPSGCGVEQYMKISAITHRLQESCSAADSDTVAIVRLGDGKADYAVTVQVLADRVAYFGRGVKDVGSQGWLPGKAADVQRTALCVILITNAWYLCVVLRTKKVWQNL